MNQTIQNFIDGKRIAVIGVSRTSSKFGNTAYNELKARGYQVFQVHPSAQELNGDKCYPNLSALDTNVDGVFISLPPRQAEVMLRESASAGLKKVWLQPGAESPKVLEVAGELGLATISGKCILMYAQPVRSYHKWHRLFVKLFGKL